ncbi:MAG: hypothetical protein HYZ49_11215 [Chloroflexi bacterium]|nr:hypothetical protein [Chloroflexota bacterium]
MKKKVLKSSVVFLASVLLISIVGTALAWGVYPAFGHTYHYGGEADSGNLGGQIEFPSGNRYVRASGEHVKWTSTQVAWIAGNRGSYLGFTYQPAMVFHVFQLNGSSCGNIRSEGVGSGWNWSNLPGLTVWGKSTCNSGKNNEIRFIASGTIVAGTEYYYQSVFRDQTYPSTWSTGMVTADSYWDREAAGYHDGYLNYKDFHTKFCASSGATVYTSGC